MTDRTLMAVGAHADDIELNVGGTLSKYHEAGYKIVYVMSTNNFSGGWSTLKPDGSVERRLPPHHEIEPQRKLEAANAARRFGTEPIHLDHPQRHYTLEDGSRTELRYGCDLPRGLEPNIPSILTAYEDDASVQRLADLILEHKPEGIMTHGIAASNIEHYATCMLVTKAYRMAEKSGYAGQLLQWLELGITIHGPLNCIWHTFIDISDYTDQKRSVAAEHACQLPIPENLDFPEWGPACGCREAEVFAKIAGHAQPGPHDAFAREIVGNMR